MASTFSGQPPASPPPDSSIQPPPPENPIEVQIEELTKKFKSGASWFFWIAGLTVASSILVLVGSNWSFAFGLGVTQIIDALAAELAPGDWGVKAVAFIFDLVIIGFVILVGVLAHQRLRWAFIVGMILYALDGLLFLIVMDIVGILVHAFVLFCFFSGLRALTNLKRLEASLAPPPYYQPAPQEPRFFPPPR